MTITTFFCAVTVAAVLAAANVDIVDRRGDAAKEAFARELAERGKQAREAMRESDALAAAR